MIAVAGGVVRRGDRILIYKRPEGKRYAGLWEFPGGKLEEGESPEEALARELREELALEVRVGGVLDALREGDILLLFYECFTEGDPVEQEMGEARFVKPEELKGYEFAPMDTRFLKRKGWL